MVYFVVIICLLISIMISLVLVKIHKFGIVISGAVAGFFSCILLNYTLFWRVKAVPSYLFFQNFLFIMTLIGAILGYEFSTYIIIISTSLLGSYITVRTLSVIFGGFPNEYELNRDLQTQTLDSIPWIFYLYLALIVILFVIGCFY